MLPTFIIIGAMKCGTSSLHNYLSAHPEIVVSKNKEINFFSNEKNFSKGLEWYESFFCGEANICGEASTNYSKYPAFKNVPERMQSILPDIKLIYMVRNPIERIISHYVHNIAHGREIKDVTAALSAPENNYYVNCSKYYMQLTRYLEYYSEENILVISLEQLRDDPRTIMKKVFGFLGVDDSFFSPEFTRIYHKSFDKRKRNMLGRFFKKIKGESIIKKCLPYSIFKIYKELSSSPIGPIILPPDIEMGVRQHLTDDMARLKNIMGDDFKYLNWQL